MKIETTRFGSQEVEQETILHFPNGLLSNTKGSDPQLKDFKLFHKEETDSEDEAAIVFWLQAVDNPDIAYEIMDPALVNFYYDIALPDEDYDLLESESTDEIVMMLMISEEKIEQQLEDSNNMAVINANVTEPLFINLNSKKAIHRSIKELDYDIFLNIPIVKLN